MVVFNNKSSVLFLLIGFCLLEISTALEAKGDKIKIESTDDIPVDKTDTSASSPKFKLRYYSNNANYKEGGSLFLYLGGQQSLENIEPEQVRVVEELATKFEGRFVVLEHRFYGKSKIYPDTDKTQFTDLTKLAKLDLNKVLDDIEAALPKLMLDMKPAPPSVFLFGSGYSGLVAMLYNLRHAGTNNAPNGTWISSAPLREFIEFDKLPTAHESRYDADLTTLFTSEFGCKDTAVSQAFVAIDNLVKEVKNADGTVNTAKTTENHKDLLNTFGINNDGGYLTADKDEKVEILKANIVQLIRDLAALNFPMKHKATVHQKSRDMQPWPVQKFCDQFKTEAADDKGRIKKLRDGLADALALQMTDLTKTDVDSLCVREDVAKSFECFLKSMLEYKGLSDDELKAKYYQSCTQVIFEKCAGKGTVGTTTYFKDFFYEQCKMPSGSDPKADYRFVKCQQTLPGLGINGYQASHFDPTFIQKKFGANSDKTQKVIFSSGKYDQYQAANYLESVPDRQIYAYDITVTAPVLDYNPPYKCDPPALSEARTQIGNILQCWAQPGKDGVKERCEKKMPTAPLSVSKRDTNKESCGETPVSDGFPWITIDYKDKPVIPPVGKPTEPPPTQPTKATTPESDSAITNFVSSFVLVLNLLLSFIVVGLTM